jgi:hypothetical protein
MWAMVSSPALDSPFVAHFNAIIRGDGNSGGGGGGGGVAGDVTAANGGNSSGMRNDRAERARTAAKAQPSAS